MTDTAFKIYQSFLDRSGRLMMDRKHAELSTMMAYPLTIETTDGSLTHPSPDDYIEAAHAFGDYMDRMQTQDFLRVAMSAEFVDGRAEFVDGVHETFMLSGGSYVVEPFRDALRLKFFDGQWRGWIYKSSVSNVQVPLLNPAQLRTRALAKLEQLTKADNNDGFHPDN